MQPGSEFGRSRAERAFAADSGRGQPLTSFRPENEGVEAAECRGWWQIPVQGTNRTGRRENHETR